MIIAPISRFVLAPDEPLKIYTPNLFFLAFNAERLERYLDVGGPTRVRSPRDYFPFAIPVDVDVAALVRNALVETDAQRIRREKKGVAVIVVSIKDDPEAIVLFRALIAPPLSGNDFVRL